MAKKDTYQKWEEDGELDTNLAIIQSLSMQGYPIAEIAKKLNIAERTFYNMIKEYDTVSAVLKSGRESVVAILQRRLLDKVNDGDTTAIIYGLKIYGGEFFLKDKLQVSAELTGKGGGAIEIDVAPQIYLPQKDGDVDE